VYLYRAIDQYGQVIDVLVSQKRDLVATAASSFAPLRTAQVRSR
jgi:transposase-like protein